MMKIICRKCDTKEEYERSSATPGPQMNIEFVSGSLGTAIVKSFASDDTSINGGAIFRFEIENGDCAFIPFAKNIENGVELHFGGEAEAEALLRALKGILAAGILKKK